MKFWVALVALTLLAGCGAELSPPGPTPPTPPALPSRVWGLLGVLGEVAENTTQRLRATLQELRKLGLEARYRLVEYGSEARALLELSAADLQSRGSNFVRKLRKRLSRDQEELQKRWEGGKATLRQLWSPPETARD